ncbi:MAG: electron transfer flavoprotein subunit alpha/FixB family protein, partial [Acidimicrobiales bacterium]
MALNRIWVYAEATDGKVSPLTLELLAKARSLGGTVEAVYGGADADAVAGTLGAHGATKVFATGDLGGSLPGVPVASAIAKQVGDGNAPDLLMMGMTYEGRDIAARLSVALDRPVITNNIDVEVDGDAVIVTEPVFGGMKLVKTKFTAAGPHI